MILEGTKAFDFSLLDQNGRKIKLSDELKQGIVVLYFYPRALTPGCNAQACSLRDSENFFKKNNIIILGISGDSIDKLKKFQDKFTLNFSLLSDESKEVCLKYGCFGPKKFMGKNFEGIYRKSFIINSNKKIIKIIEKVDTKNHSKQIKEALVSLGLIES